MAEETGGIKSDSDLVGWLISTLFILIIVGAIFANLEERIAARQQEGDFSFLSIFGFNQSLPELTSLGTKVEVARDTLVFDFPDGTQIGEQLKKARGKLVGGPLDGWWDVDFSFAPDGWVNGDDLFVVPSKYGVGDSVMIADTTSVHASPAGLYLGPQESGARGTIIDGPVTLDSGVWLHVDFEEDPDGWVLESDLSDPPGFFSVLFARIVTLLWWLSGIVTVLSVIGIVYTLIRLHQIGKAQNKAYSTPGVGSFVQSEEELSHKNERWEHIESLVASENPADWRLAVLEADILLDRLVAAMYPTAGTNLGERMRVIEPSDFLTLDKAWEAHKVRNMIAHEGSDFILTQREARRVVGLFGEVFREFSYI